MIFDMATCGGCRTCEIACSFKPKGVFMPAISSIKILENGNEPGFRVLLVEQGDEQSMACNGCKDLNTLPCVEYCDKGEDIEKILREFIEKIR